MCEEAFVNEHSTALALSPVMWGQDGSIQTAYSIHSHVCLLYQAEFPREAELSIEELYLITRIDSSNQRSSEVTGCTVCHGEIQEGGGTVLSEGKGLRIRENKVIDPILAQGRCDVST